MSSDDFEDSFDGRFYAENGMPADYKCFEECLAEASTPQEGFWSAFTALSWIATRQERFTAASQIYQERNYSDRGGIFASTTWGLLAEASQRTGGTTLQEAARQLQVAVETGYLKAGIAFDPRERSSVEVPMARWGDWQRTFDDGGLTFLPGMSDLRWPSANVREAFPPLKVVDAPQEDRPRGRRLYNNQNPTPGQKTAADFLAWAKKDKTLQGKTQVELHEEYLKRFIKDKGEGERRPKYTGKPLGLTRFKEIIRRDRQDRRVVDGKWEDAEEKADA
jgi:hypothetical protein